jgi:hypothetical protein
MGIGAFIAREQQFDPPRGCGRRPRLKINPRRLVVATPPEIRPGLPGFSLDALPCDGMIYKEQILRNQNANEEIANHAH